MRILFATSNIYKINEATRIFEPIGINISAIDLNLIEPQSTDPHTISKFKAKNAYNEVKKPIIVDDAGLFVERLNGFPGTLTAPIAKMIGNEQLAKLLKDGDKARFQTVITYIDNDSEITVEGTIEGKISLRRVDRIGLLSDIFIPLGYHDSLTALSEKGVLSHRKIALEKLSKLIQNGVKHADKI